MWIKVIVSGSAGRHVEHIDDVQEKGDLGRIVGDAVDIFREKYRDAPAFDYSIKVSNA